MMKITPNSNGTNELGLTASDEAALESVGDLRASLGIPDGEHLTAEVLQAALKKKGQAATTARLAMAIRNRDHKLATRPTAEYNKNHDAKGRFASGPGGGAGGGVFYVDTAKRYGRQLIGRTVAVRAKDEASAMAAVRSGGLRARIAWAAKDQTGATIPTDQWLVPMNQKAADVAAGKNRGVDPFDQAMADFGPDDQAQAAKARMARAATGAAPKVQLVPDAPALSTPRPINGTLRSGMDTNVVTIPYGRERALKSSKYIKKYILSGRDVTLNTAAGSGTADITNFAPGSTLVFRYKGDREVGSLKVPRQTVPWDGAAEPKGVKKPSVNHAEKYAKLAPADLHRAVRRNRFGNTGSAAHRAMMDEHRRRMVQDETYRNYIKSKGWGV